MSKEKKRKIVDDTKEGLVYFEIWGILFILFSLILISELGPVGEMLNTLVKMIFGDWYWLILIFLVYYGVMMIIYHEFITFSSIKIKGIIFISAGLLVYSHFPIFNALQETIITNKSNIVTESYNIFMDYVDQNFQNPTYGGGLLGAFIFWVFYALLGLIGTQIIAIILLISGVAYLFEKTIYDFIDDLINGIIRFYKSTKNFIGGTFGKMKNVSSYNKNQKTETVNERVSMHDMGNQKFEQFGTTKNIKIHANKKKYIKPNIKRLHYQDNKMVLENQKEITVSNARIINDFLGAFYLNLEISEVYIGPTISTFIIEVDNGIQSKKILNYKNDLMSRLDTENIRIFEKYENKQCVYVEVPNEHRYLVSLREVLEEDETQHEIPIGRNYRGKLYGIDFNNLANILIIGHDINSKIGLLKTIIQVINYKYEPQDFQLVLCDSTKFELDSFDAIPHLFHPFIHSFQSMKPMLIKLYTEVEKRLNELDGKKNTFTPILLVLNDFVDFYINNQDYLKYLNYILVYGGKVNVYTIYATSNMDDKILTNNLRAQFDGIISFMIKSKEISFKYLEEDTTKLLKEGDCIVFSRVENTSVRVQTVNLSKEDETFI